MPAPLRLVCRADPALPPLAWAARLRRGAGLVEVVHGPWVETLADGFVEGAWDGPFAAGAFDEAAALCGSGGRLVDGTVRFAAPSHMFERLHSIATGEVLHVANSLPLLLVVAGAALDPGHAGYLFDYLRHYRAGIGGPEQRLPLAGGQVAAIHHGGILTVGPDLATSWRARSPGTAPDDYRQHVDDLRATLGRLVDNAGDRRRRHPFRPLVTLSQGYDSTAAAALASGAGCREAVSFRRSRIWGGGEGDDSGTAIGACLGLAVTLYDRTDYLALDGPVDAEFFVNARLTTDKGMAVMAAQLAGGLVITGRFGENLWGRGAESGQPLFREPNALLMSGATLTDFRLRVGFVHLPLPATAALQAPAIRRITDAAEMRPWSVGGGYDRPIPRRIAEEAGVPRALFGHRKMGGAIGADRLSAASRDDFAAWCARQAGAGHRLPAAPPRWLRRLKLRLQRRPELLWPLHRVFGDRLDPRWHTPDLYLFHWGVDHLLARYRPARATLDAPAARAATASPTPSP